MTFVLFFSDFSSVVAFAKTEIVDAVNASIANQEMRLTQNILDEVNADETFASGTIVRFKNGILNW